MACLTKKNFSASELQRQLGHSTNNPILAMLNKLCEVMGKRDSEYNLEGFIELDEGLFSTETSKDEKKDKLRRGRGSQKKSKVLVMVESVPMEVGAVKKDGKPRKVGH